MNASARHVSMAHPVAISCARFSARAARGLPVRAARQTLTTASLCPAKAEVSFSQHSVGDEVCVVYTIFWSTV